MREYKFSRARYAAVFTECREAINFGNNKIKKPGFKYGLSDTYESMEERYNTACEYYLKKIKKKGLELPSKYLNLKGKFLQFETTSEIGHIRREPKKSNYDAILTVKMS